jgi:hypothetical protein
LGNVPIFTDAEKSEWRMVREPGYFQKPSPITEMEMITLIQKK